MLLIVLYLLLVIVLPLGLSAVVSLRTLPEGRGCPVCRGDTMRVLARWLGMLSRPLSRSALHRRWCPTCGWEGVARVPALQMPAAAVRPARGQGRQSREIGEAVGLRDLEVDGDAWQVLVQYWCDLGEWHGRLLFISPSGRLWADHPHPFSGGSPDEVMSQALALSERALTGRLRELISD